MGGDTERNLWMNPVVHFIYTALSRSVYGGCLTYLVAAMLDAHPDESITGYRPTSFLRWFLSWDFWVPIARLSYSVYLWHIVIIVFICAFDVIGIFSNL